MPWEFWNPWNLDPLYSIDFGMPSCLELVGGINAEFSLTGILDDNILRMFYLKYENWNKVSAYLFFSIKLLLLSFKFVKLAIRYMKLNFLFAYVIIFPIIVREKFDQER